MPTSHDIQYKRLFQACFEDLIKGFFPDIHAALDFSKFGPANFLTNEYYVDHRNKRKLIADLVARVPQKGDTDYVLILTENQHVNTTEFLERVLLYYISIYMRHRKPVIPIVLYTGDSRAPLTEREKVFTLGFGTHTFLRFECLAVRLRALDAKGYLRSSNPLLVALAARMGYPEQKVVDVKLDILRRLPGLVGRDTAKLDALGQFVETYISFQKDLARQKEFESRLRHPENKEVNVILNLWEKKGEEKGEKKGAEKMRLATARSLLCLGTTPTIISKATGLSMARVRALGSRNQTTGKQTPPARRRTPAKQKIER